MITRRAPRGMIALAAALRLYVRLRDFADDLTAALCGPDCPNHPVRMTMPTPNDQERGPRSPMRNLPGETPEEATERARTTVRRAAAAGNPLAQKMAKRQDKEDRKAGRKKT